MSASDPAIPDLEVRITPLLRGIPGTSEDLEGNGVTTIDIEDTVLVEQVTAVEVNMAVDEGRNATVVLSSHDPAVEGLEPYQHALWIGYWRPGEVQAETVFFGQTNVSDNFEGGTVTLNAQDPTGKAQHHYLRRGDEALNIDKNRGRLEPHAFNFEVVMQAARNTDEQQDREVPVLGLKVDEWGDFTAPPFNDEGGVEFERGQEVWDLLVTWASQANGPQMDVVPNWLWPIANAYAFLDLYDPPTDPEAPGLGELGRYLAPADPDDPAAGEVVWDYGLGNDTLEDCAVDPGRPGTHQHVLDRDKAYRETSADAESSAEVGVWVDWVEADLTIARPSGNDPRIPADTSPLRELADARVKAYGKPVKHTTLKLRPDVALDRHFGHPRWVDTVSGERIGGDWYLGDYVLARALRGFRSFAQLVRIVGVKIHRSAPDYLVRFDVEVIPAIGGVPGPNTDEGSAGVGGDGDPPTVSFAQPEPDGIFSGDEMQILVEAFDDDGIASVEIKVDGVAITGGFFTAAPYFAFFDTTTLTDGMHTVSAEAIDGHGDAATASIAFEVSNALPTCTLTSPTAGATVTGTITLTATAGGEPISYVEFLVDGVLLSGADTSSPFTKSWNSTTVPNGAHTIAARATDTDGQQTVSTAVNVTVAN